MEITFVLTILITICHSEIIDYTNNEYLLLKDEKDVMTYNSFEDLFHITNLSFYREIIRVEDNITNSSKNSDLEWDISQNLNIIKILMSQLLPSRNKRGINELGTAWKWLSGTPDHDDLTRIENKINELTENNNKQFTINSRIFQEVQLMTKILNTIVVKKESKVRQHRLQLITLDIQNLIDTITLAKANILNTKILNEQDIKEIFRHENKPVVLTDLLDISTFKIIKNQDLLIIYIRYPIINNICSLYTSRAIAQINGKLIIDDKTAHCNGIFYKITNFKEEIFNNYCKLSNESSCFTNLLNGKKANCSKIREKNKQLENLDDGAILITGENTVNEIKLKGAFLILFNESIIINNINYINEKQKMLDYISQYKYNNYIITDYIFSNDSELSLDNINIINPFVKLGKTKISLELILLIFILTLLIIYKSRKIIPKIIKQIQIKCTKTQKEIEIPKAEITTETVTENETERNIEITFTELNNRISSLTAQM